MYTSGVQKAVSNVNDVLGPSLIKKVSYYVLVFMLLKSGFAAVQSWFSADGQKITSPS